MRSSSPKQALVNLTPQRRELIRQLLCINHKEVIEHGVFDYINEFCVLAGLLVLEAEVETVVGPRYSHDPDREFVRHGTQQGKIKALGQMVPIEKPRIRTKDKLVEYELESYLQLSSKDVLNNEFAQKLIHGLSTRSYGGVVEKLLESTTLSRQSVSRRAKESMEKTLEEFRTRSLQELDIVAIFVDGIGIGESVHVVALGLDSTGKKHVLGMEHGSTEKSGVCKSLISNLFERGLKEDEKYLFVIDGSKALRKAIKEVFGRDAEVQRCIEHKKRNVLDHLPKSKASWFRGEFAAAYSNKTYKAASRAFQNLIQKLYCINERATKALAEGLEELLTLHRLKVDGKLRKSLCTTNCIESTFATARYYMRNVKRWRKDIQMERWLACGLLKAESTLKKIPGYTRMPGFIKALRG